MNELSRTDIEYFEETLSRLLVDADADADTCNDMMAICAALVEGYRVEC